MAVEVLRRALFLDKDGTLIPDIPYNVNPERITLTEGVGETLRVLQDQGYLLVVVTNQSGVARGYFPESALPAVEAKLRQLLDAHGVWLDGFVYCPHHPQGTVAEYAITCDCRKPQPGLLRRAADQWGIDLAQSWMIGDIASDIHAGRSAGCSTILFAQYCDRAKEVRASAPDFVADRFPEIAEIVGKRNAR